MSLRNGGGGVHPRGTAKERRGRKFLGQNEEDEELLGSDDKKKRRKNKNAIVLGGCGCIAAVVIFIILLIAALVILGIYIATLKNQVNDLEEKDMNLMDKDMQLMDTDSLLESNVTALWTKTDQLMDKDMQLMDEDQRLQDQIDILSGNTTMDLMEIVEKTMQLMDKDTGIMSNITDLQNKDMLLMDKDSEHDTEISLLQTKDMVLMSQISAITNITTTLIVNGTIQDVKLMSLMMDAMTLEDTVLLNQQLINNNTLKSGQNMMDIATLDGEVVKTLTADSGTCPVSPISNSIDIEGGTYISTTCSAGKITADVDVPSLVPALAPSFAPISVVTGLTGAEADSGGIATGPVVDFAGGTHCDTTRSANTITIDVDAASICGSPSCTSLSSNVTSVSANPGGDGIDVTPTTGDVVVTNLMRFSADLGPLTQFGSDVTFIGGAGIETEIVQSQPNNFGGGIVQISSKIDIPTVVTHHWCKAFIDDRLSTINDYDFRSNVQVQTWTSAKVVHVTIDVTLVGDEPNESGSTALASGTIAGANLGLVSGASTPMQLCEGPDDQLPLDTFQPGPLPAPFGFEYCEIGNGFGPCDCFNTNPAPGHHAPCIPATTGFPAITPASYHIASKIWKVDTVGRWVAGTPFAIDYILPGVPQPLGWVGHSSPLEDFLFLHPNPGFSSPVLTRAFSYGFPGFPIYVMGGHYSYPLQ